MLIDDQLVPVVAHKYVSSRSTNIGCYLHSGSKHKINSSTSQHDETTLPPQLVPQTNSEQPSSLNMMLFVSPSHSEAKNIEHFVEPLAFNLAH